jgi:acyl-coenzyme A synthetase/AMP-(fatty) acid ligase
MNLLLKAIFNLIMTWSIVDFLLFFLEQCNDSLQSIFVGVTSLFYDGFGPEGDVFLHIIKKQKVAQVSASATLLSSSDAYE